MAIKYQQIDYPHQTRSKLLFHMLLIFYLSTLAKLKRNEFFYVQLSYRPMFLLQTNN